MSHFEVFILNYNGEHFLNECLSALQQLRSDPHSFTVNVIDNGSIDESKKLVTSSFPKVNFIPLGKNLGFSNGNNAGVKIRTKQLRKEEKHADFYVFLNNDTAVEPDWLLQAAATFERDSNIGIVGSKSVFYDRFVVLNIRCESPFSPKDFGTSDTRCLGVRLHEPITGENLISESSRRKYFGAYSIEGDRRWLSSDATLYLPIRDTNTASEITISLENLHPGGIPQRVFLTVNGRAESARTFEIEANCSTQIILPVSVAEYATVIQNAGSFVKTTWEAGDVGFLEIDHGQFEAEREVAAVCGVSLFIRAELFKRLGGFESHTFAYYEDTDLSLRARLNGSKCVYAPKSILRHVHCGSGVENSNYFTKNVTYSRFLLASKMMERKPWNELLKRYWLNAKAEYRAYRLDSTIDDKPFLNSIRNYLKYQILFRKNRIYANLKKPAERLSYILTD